MTGEVDINPSTKVGDLLDAYPELEDELIRIAPAFKRLKNPFVRRAVAKAATVKHISSVGGVPLNELINKFFWCINRRNTPLPFPGHAIILFFELKKF